MQGTACRSALKRRFADVQTLLLGQSRCMQTHLQPDKKQILAMIKELRASSGAPMGDVKSALEEVQYDMDKAFEALRKKGVAAAAKKATRSAAQGLVHVVRGPGCAALVEVNSETDFVARSDVFVAMLPRVAQAALDAPGRTPTGAQSLDVADLLASSTSSDATETVADAVAQVAASVRENVQLRRCSRLFSPGYIATYVHNAVAPGSGLVAAAVAIEAKGGELPSAADLEGIGKQLAMQIVAMTPVSVTRDGVPEAMLAKERDILREVAIRSGKAPQFVEKIVDGRLGKFYEEHVLLDQKSILDDKITVRKVLAEASGRVGAALRVADFVYMKVGDGLERQ